MAKDRWEDPVAHISINSAMTQDYPLKTYQLRCQIEILGGNKSIESERKTSRPDDDDDEQ